MQEENDGQIQRLQQAIELRDSRIHEVQRERDSQVQQKLQVTAEKDSQLKTLQKTLDDQSGNVMNIAAQRLATRGVGTCNHVEVLSLGGVMMTCRITAKITAT